MSKVSSCPGPGALGGPALGRDQGRRENFRAPGQKIRLGPLVSGAPKTHDQQKKRS